MLEQGVAHDSAVEIVAAHRHAVGGDDVGRSRGDDPPHGQVQRAATKVEHQVVTTGGQALAQIARRRHRFILEGRLAKPRQPRRGQHALMGGAVDLLGRHGWGGVGRGVGDGPPDDGSGDRLAQICLGALTNVAQHQGDELLGSIVAPIDGGAVEAGVAQTGLDRLEEACGFVFVVLIRGVRDDHQAVLRLGERVFGHLGGKHRGDRSQIGEAIANGRLAGQVEVALDGRSPKEGLARARAADGGG